MKKIQDAKIEGKKVLLRTDFNVPMKGDKITDDLRIREALPTIKYLQENGAAQIIIVTHLGRPKGHTDEFCLWLIANRLIELLGIDKKYYDCPQKEYEISPNIIMLENIRFDYGEEENSSELAQKLAKRADVFVNDAFGAMHRAHTSTVGVAKLLPSYAGLLVEKEIENLSKILAHHQSGFVVILGGAKTADKLPLVKNLISRADKFLIGGAIANTFLAARDQHHLGKSAVEEGAFRQANEVWNKIMDEPDKDIFLPEDVVLSKSLDEPIDTETVKIGDLQSGKFQDYYAVDIGPKTIEHFEKQITNAKIIFWNGNMGISEVPDFNEGTKAIAEAIAASGAQKFAGGGDTTSFIRQNHLEDKFDFLSTGGGATLEYLAGKNLPGLEVLE